MTTVPEPPGRSTRIDPEPPGPPEDPPAPAPEPLEKPVVAPRSEKSVVAHRQEHPRRRVPIGKILTVLAFGSIASVGLLHGKAVWANVTFLATVFLLGVSLLGVLRCHEVRRASWQGFALFGWGYLGMAFLPWFSHHPNLDLPTCRLIGEIHARVAASTAPGIVSETSKAVKATFAAGDLEQFLVVGHCSFALLAALIGSAIAQWFYRTELAPA